MSLEKQLEIKLKELEITENFDELDEFEKGIILPLAASMLRQHEKNKKIDTTIKENGEILGKIQEDTDVLSNKLESIQVSIEELKIRQLELQQSQIKDSERRAELRELESRVLMKLIDKLG